MEDLGAWNAEFDPNLLSVWTDTSETDGAPANSNLRKSSAEDGKEESPEVYEESKRDGSTSSLRGDGSWDGNVNQWAHLGVPAFSVDEEPALSEKSNKSTDLLMLEVTDMKEPSKEEMLNHADDRATTSRSCNGNGINNNAESNSSAGDVVAAISETASVTSGRDDNRSATTGSSGSSSRTPNSSNQSSSLLHPLAIQSSASCPAPAYPLLDGGGPPVIPQPSTPGDLYSVDLSRALERSRVGSVPHSQRIGTHDSASHQQSTTNQSQHLSSLTTNFLLAAASAGPQAPAVNHQHAAANHNGHHVTGMAHHPTATSAASNPHAAVQHVASERQSATVSAGSSTATTAHLPPFYLFDAPIELRANFMQNQRKLGLTIEHDPNSYHYGETVNGFHPQQLLMAGAVGQQRESGAPTNIFPSGMMDPTKVGAVAAAMPKLNDPPQLIDARHGINRRSKGGQMKNEREQKRAQKITELIDQLRIRMEDGGWQVEGRSKFNTLSKCAEYVKHMVKSTSEKAEAVDKLKTDLDVKKRKVEEDKAIQEARSDPESVTSSLTADTTGSSRTQNSQGVDKKRKAVDKGKLAALRAEKKKKHRIMSSEAATEDSSGEDRGGGSGTGSGSGSGGARAHGYSIGKTISTVSDLTDSNRCSSSNNSGSGSGSTDEIPTEQDSGESGSCEEEGKQASTSSISSDAAVASEKSSREKRSGHKDVVFKNDRGRKRPPEEVTSLERSFELDYEEVFDKSNIPQVIATTSGKIVTWNECFVKATGYRKSEIERMTIFSLVTPEKLSKFFDIVAAALRPEDDEKTDREPTSEEIHENAKDKALTEAKVERRTSSESKHSDKNTSTEAHVAENGVGEGEQEAEDLPHRLLDYTAITLPCIEFPAMKKRNQYSSDSGSVIDPLTVTVTLMSDKDPRRRCFHCVLTNCRGTDGALGSITPDLLASLFSTPLRRRKKHLPNKRKRARTLAGPSSFVVSNNKVFEKTESLPPPPNSVGDQMPDETNHGVGNESVEVK
eukprot:CAMPEP_0178855524 /NCGR_PEP_ID=MMETSP0746-20121128/23445_1 /TAXON_ID=913974 /ORGANISM="Nitzschia punctata, Strain CCMP561" /LENGTH=1011 /DNA_ID=CAMNT_0020521649 /DNA_START=157 /DNA_END=3192 /DNA_ORIENTATION=-